MDGRILGRVAAATKRLSAPRAVKASSIKAAAVTLKWSAPKGSKPAYYTVTRDGKPIGRTTKRTYTDKKVKPGKTYRYAVRAYDKHKQAGKLSASVRVKVPKLVAKAPTTNPVPAVAPVAPAAPAVPAPPVLLSAAMVERLFWRAGYGPSAADRATWTGRPVDELVDWFVNTPLSHADTATPPKDADGNAIDPLGSDVELELEWLDKMQRALNPLPHRLAFFWHRHWAVSREDGIPNQWILDYRDRLLRYSDLGANPGATFRSLAYEMTTADTAMSMYLNINQNVKGKPNENYAREFMELFCLGPKAPDGTDNYSQSDVAELAKAFTGWTYQGDSKKPGYGVISFGPGRFEMGAKTVLGTAIAGVSGSTDTTRNPAAAAWGTSCVNQAVDIVLAHPNHPQFLIRKLWAEFIASPIPQGTLDALVANYRGSGYQLKPLMRSILTNPLIFESIDEPNLIKAPMVFIVGALRQLDVPLKYNQVEAAMNAMQQKVYFPPNVAGWEGGMSWLNTNTVQGRFDLLNRLQYLKYSNYYVLPQTVTDATVNYPKDNELPADPSAATADQWMKAAMDSLNTPWISAATRTSILAFAATALASKNNATLRRQRLYSLQALILGGPDGQVM